MRDDYDCVATYLCTYNCKKNTVHFYFLSCQVPERGWIIMIKSRRLFFYKTDEMNDKKTGHLNLFARKIGR